jgi:hypothetical protein
MTIVFKILLPSFVSSSKSLHYIQVCPPLCYVDIWLWASKVQILSTIPSIHPNSILRRKLVSRMWYPPMRDGEEYSSRRSKNKTPKGTVFVEIVLDSMVGIVLKCWQRTRLSRCRKIWLLAHPLRPSPCRSTGDTQEDWEREKSCWRERGKEGGRGAESCKAWTSVNYSTLSGCDIYCRGMEWR